MSAELARAHTHEWEGSTAEEGRLKVEVLRDGSVLILHSRPGLDCGAARSVIVPKAGLGFLAGAIFRVRVRDRKSFNSNQGESDK